MASSGTRGYYHLRPSQLPTVPQSFFTTRDFFRTTPESGKPNPQHNAPLPVTYPPLRELYERLWAVTHIPDCRPHEISLHFVSFLFRAHSGSELLPVSCDLHKKDQNKAHSAWVFWLTKHFLLTTQCIDYTTF